MWEIYLLLNFYSHFICLHLNNSNIYLSVYSIYLKPTSHFEPLTVNSNKFEYILKIEPKYRSNYIIKIISDYRTVWHPYYFILHDFGSTTTVEHGLRGMSKSTKLYNLILIVTCTASTPSLGVPTSYLKSLTRALSKENDMKIIKQWI